MCEENKQINGFCNYCKDEIHLNEPHVVENNDKYHVECYRQMKCYVDIFGEEEV